MITGFHAVLFTTEAQRAREFLADVLGLDFVDAGDGWLIYRLPPAELAPHPSTEAAPPQLYLMCDDIEATVAELADRGVPALRPVSGEGWGLVTAIELPGAGEIGLYEPRHPTPPPAVSVTDRR